RLPPDVARARPCRPPARGRPVPARADPKSPRRADGPAPLLLRGRPRVRRCGEHGQALHPGPRDLVPGRPPPPLPPTVTAWLVKSPKPYWTDLGLARLLAGHEGAGRRPLRDGRRRRGAPLGLLAAGAAGPP